MVYITGDTHGDFSRLDNFKFKKDDLLIVLGDACINYSLNDDDKRLKEYLKKYNTTIFCIRGNHDERPENISTYKEVDMYGGKVYIEDEYPYLVFAKDGEEYNINGKKILVIGGAYSVDAEYRLMNGIEWFKDEQLSEEEMNKIMDKVKGKEYDLVLTHTCPHKYEPVEDFLPSIDQTKVDRTMEYFSDKVDERIGYKKWYCGHFHINKTIDKMIFLFDDIRGFDER